MRRRKDWLRSTWAGSRKLATFLDFVDQTRSGWVEIMEFYNGSPSSRDDWWGEKWRWGRLVSLIDFDKIRSLNALSLLVQCWDGRPHSEKLQNAHTVSDWKAPPIFSRAQIVRQVDEWSPYTFSAGNHNLARKFRPKFCAVEDVKTCRNSFKKMMLWLEGRVTSVRKLRQNC